MITWLVWRQHATVLSLMTSYLRHRPLMLKWGKLTAWDHPGKHQSWTMQGEWRSRQSAMLPFSKRRPLCYSTSVFIFFVLVHSEATNKATSTA